MDLIKEAFQRIKQDILALREELSELRNQLSRLKQPQNTPTIPTQTPTQPLVPTDNPTHIPTHNQGLDTENTLNLPLKSHVSIGNRGVPTDKQTNRQTDKQTDKWPQITQKTDFSNKITNIDDFEKVTKVLESLDNIKKEIRLKFKRLTHQEMLIFSTLYTLEEQNIEEITYKLIANNLNLSESSIRDYINKLTNKGVPIIKIRQNNKKITLSISPDLKKIASLATIIKLREL